MFNHGHLIDTPGYRVPSSSINLMSGSSSKHASSQIWSINVHPITILVVSVTGGQVLDKLGLHRRGSDI